MNDTEQATPVETTNSAAGSGQAYDETPHLRMRCLELAGRDVMTDAQSVVNNATAFYGFVKGA